MQYVCPLGKIKIIIKKKIHSHFRDWLTAGLVRWQVEAVEGCKVEAASWRQAEVSPACSEAELRSNLVMFSVLNV